MRLFDVFTRRRQSESRKPRARKAGRRLEVEALEGRIVPVRAGTFDPSFGTSGVATLSFNQPGQSDVAADVAVQADGRIVVVGSSAVGSGTNHDFAVTRFNSNGTLDTSFGNAGRQVIPFNRGGSNNDWAEAVAIDAQGRIVVAGTIERGGLNRDFGVMRLIPDGRLDVTFGDAGKTVVAFDMGPFKYDAAHGLAIDNQGRIIVVGEVDHGTNYIDTSYDFGIARLTASGYLDGTFNGTGRATVSFNLWGSSRYDAAADVALDSQGRIVVAGTVNRLEMNFDFAVARLTPTGALDSAFGSSGRQTFALDQGGDNRDWVSALALDNLGRIVVAGSVRASSGDNFGVLRLTTAGQLDTAFGSGGKQFVDFGPGGREEAADVAVDDQGRIVLAGSSRRPNQDEDFVAARLTASGMFDATFGSVLGGGRIVLPLDLGGSNWDAGRAVAIDREGRVVLAGGADVGTHTDFAVVRLGGGNSIRVVDASGDSTPSNVFLGGAVRVSYHFAQPAAPVERVSIEAVRWPSGAVITLLDYAYAESLPKETHLVDLRSVPLLTAGTYNVQVRAHLTNDQTITSTSVPLFVLAQSSTTGDLQGESFTLSSSTAAVFAGRGGTDTLDLGVASSSILSVNGLSWSDFMATRSTYRQAIYQGSAYDFLRLTDGREIYFQGIERLQLTGGQAFELVPHPNDPQFANQWNLHVTDVPGAWRFTTGGDNVLLVSLDNGILTPAGVADGGGLRDINFERLLTDATDDVDIVPPDDPRYSHGHMSSSVMAAWPNNASGVAGINWNSPVMVADVYRGVFLQRAISDGVALARANGQRVVFQGGIQGEFWLTHGGTQAALEELIRNSADVAIFAIAAGNGGPGGGLDDPNYLNSVSGVAKLETTHGNVMAVGALKRTGTATVHGLMNASTVDIAVYSNRGPNLTLMAPTDSPALDKFGMVRIYGGTSCANPNLAAITSLVWGVNTALTSSTVRQILIDTATNLGTPGRDNTYGWGLVNAEAAVRRASALARDREVAQLVPIGPSLFRLVPIGFAPTIPTPPSPPAVPDAANFGHEGARSAEPGNWLAPCAFPREEGGRQPTPAEPVHLARRTTSEAISPAAIDARLVDRVMVGQGSSDGTHATLWTEGASTEEGRFRLGELVDACLLDTLPLGELGGGSCRAAR